MRNHALIEARVNAGLEIHEVAERAGLGAHIIRGAESGRRPRPANAKAIADVFGREVTDFFPIEAGAKS